jgi:hypothetical protein
MTNKIAVYLIFNQRFYENTQYRLMLNAQWVTLKYGSAFAEQ